MSPRTRAFALVAVFFLTLGFGQTTDPRASVALRPEECECHVALALRTAMSGDFAAAIAELEGVQPADDVAKQRIAAELARMRAWVELRDKWLGELVAAKQPLKLEFHGKKISAPVAAIANGELELAQKSGGVQRVPVSALDPEQVAALAKTTIPPEREWLAIYPYCVTGNPKWKRLSIANESPELAALRADAESFYPSAFGAGTALQQLAALIEGDWPPPLALAKTKLEQLVALWNEHRGDACIAARGTALRALAQVYLETMSLELGASAFVHVPIETKGDILRLAYPFERDTELADFLPDDEFLAWRHGKLPKIRVPVEQSALSMSQGFLFGAGAKCVRHVLEFEAPMTVRYRLRWQAIPDMPKDAMTLSIGMCGDPKGANIRCQGVTALWVDERQEAEAFVELSGSTVINENQIYAIEVRNDGKNAEAWVDGVKRATLPVGERRAGRVFLWFHTNLRVAIDQFEIEGKLVQASLDACRRAWVERKLNEYGLPR